MVAFDSIWLALSDAPGAMEFATHTNTLHAAVEAHKECNESQAFGPGAARTPNDSCLMQWQRDRGLDYDHGFFRPDLRAGDAVMFNGHTVHTGVARDLPRVAISLRYLPLDSSQSLVRNAGERYTDRESLQDAPWRDYSSGRVLDVQRYDTVAPSARSLRELL